MVCRGVQNARYPSTSFLVVCGFSNTGLSHASPPDVMEYSAARLTVVCFLGSGLILAQPPEAPQLDADRLTDATPAEQPVSLKKLPTHFLHDQESVWTFPWKVAQGKHWKPVLAVALGTAGLVALDPHTEPYFHDRSGFSSYKTGPLRGRNSTIAITVTPLAFYVTGLAKQPARSEHGAAGGRGHRRYTNC